MVTYFENFIEHLKDKYDPEMYSDIKNIFHMSMKQYLSLPPSEQRKVSDQLSACFIEHLPLIEKLALFNYVGYFALSKGQQIIIALHISKFEDFLKNTSYSGITDILDSNMLEVHSKSGFSEYFVLDQCLDILAFYDYENISDYINSLMPDTIDYLLCRSRHISPDGMTMAEYFGKTIYMVKTDKLMEVF